MLTQISIIWPLVGNLAERAKSLKNNLFLQVFETLGLPTSRPNRQQIEPKAIKNQLTNQSTSQCMFLSIFGRFGVDFGSKLRAKLEPSWHQNPKNDDINWMSKKHKILSRRGLRKGSASSLGLGPLEYFKSSYPRDKEPSGRPETLHSVPEARWRIYIYIYICIYIYSEKCLALQTLRCIA